MDGGVDDYAKVRELAHRLKLTQHLPLWTVEDDEE